ncbi:hypothetical protein [Litoribrevibacter albus]|uniref:Glycine zipper family protein n=1 Tax=Litoribrevibacter albus TaxID=1473156 RepID=A0AA37SCN0_9GAMM|nr:hypothetical protein [Litoribrevibacter albus]GLQ33600.1 hypothetical protein GCM10007876_40800 [Litoribrevibacter albus]
MSPDSRKVSHLKAMLVGGGIVGTIGAFLGFMAGLTLEGSGSGFLIGWIIGEIYGVATVSDSLE